MPQLLTATAAASSAGDAAVTTPPVQHLSAAGGASSSGESAVANELPLGGLTDFGLWVAGQPDTAMSRDVSHATGTDSSASRGWLAATAPTSYTPAGATPLWNEAVYAGVGVKWTGVAAGEKHSFGNVQFEKVTQGNRLNWAATSWEGRTCYTAQSNVNGCYVSASTTTALSGTTSGEIIYTGLASGSWGYWINPATPTGMAPCTPGEVLSASVSVNMQRAAWWTAGVQFYDTSYNMLGSWNYSQFQQHPGGGKWSTSYVFNVTAPANTAWVAVVPHISINSTPSATDATAPIGEVAYCDAHRIWSRPYNVQGTPTAYTSPRELAITVKANRVNLVNNPSFTSDTWGWGAFGTGNAPYPVSQDSTTGRTTKGTLKFSVPANLSTYTGLSSTIGTGLLTGWNTNDVGGFGWQPSTTYTSSAYVKLGPGCPPITLYTGGYTATAGVLSTTDALLSHPELVDENGWIRLWGTFTTGGNDNGLVGLKLGISLADVEAGGQGATFWVDDAANETGTQLLDYFDGNSPGSDYLWAGTTNRSSSHYYRGFRSNYYRLNDIVKAAVPHGTQFQILVAQPPS